MIIQPKIRACCLRRLLRSISTVLLLALPLTGLGQLAGQRARSFDDDPGWEGYRSRLIPEFIPITRQDFGWRDTSHSGRRGEIGGWVQRSLTPASYAQAVPQKTLTNRLSAAGKFTVTKADGQSGLLFGWFNENSRGWRTPNSLVFRLDGNGGKYWVFYEYGTQHWLTGGSGCFEGEHYQTTPTKPLRADGTPHTWALTYEPDGHGGNGLITFVLDGKTYTRALSPGHKSDGGLFNRFGLFNVQIAGKGMEAYFSELVLDGQPLDLRKDPGWAARGNKAEFAERRIRPYHDFGWTPTGNAGGKPGEIGGFIWRDEKPAYYADKVGPLTLENELSASGRVSLHTAGSDSDIYLGWFDSSSKTNKITPDHQQPPKNLLAIAIGGPSRIGHYFRAAYRTAGAEGAVEESGPVIRPDGQVHRWSLHYSPRGAEGRGQITLKFDDHIQTLDLKPSHRQRGARFDRFGLFNVQEGGHFVEVYVDELIYTFGG